MLAKTIDVQKTDADLKELVQWVKEGAEITLTDGDTVVAKVVPMDTPPNPRIPNLHPGGWVSDDFDAPLPDEFWLGESTP